MSDCTRRALVGFILLVPACVLCASGLLGLEPPAALVHPLPLVSSLGAAIAFNVVTVVRVQGRGGAAPGPSHVTIRIERRPLNLAVIASGSLLAGIIALYLFVENFAPR